VYRRLSSFLNAAARQRRDMLRIGLQTALAAAATYGAATWLGLPQVSMAVISALFTIQISADASFAGALGRLAGAVIGIALGLAATWTTGPVLVGLVLAVALANAVAAVRPGLRYAAVTAAIVALDPSPEIRGALETAALVLIGTVAGFAASLAVFPVFDRNRAADMLRNTLADCATLLELIAGGAERERREALHGRFLGHLQTVRARIAQSRFRLRAAEGTRLRRAADAVESLWHTLVVLDRAMSVERHLIPPAVMDQLRPPVREVQKAAEDYLGTLVAGLTTSHLDPPPAERLGRAIARARDCAEAHLNAARDPGGLRALAFALDELERWLPVLLAEVGELVGVEAPPEAAIDRRTGRTAPRPG
jgi:uncharacterized membrane protein YccC